MPERSTEEKFSIRQIRSVKLTEILFRNLRILSKDHMRRLGKSKQLRMAISEEAAVHIKNLEDTKRFLIYLRKIVFPQKGG